MKIGAKEMKKAYKNVKIDQIEVKVYIFHPKLCLLKKTCKISSSYTMI